MATVSFKVHAKSVESRTVEFKTHKKAYQGSSARFNTNYRTSSGSVRFLTHHKAVIRGSKRFTTHYSQNPQLAFVGASYGVWEQATQSNEGQLTASYSVNGHSLGEAPYKFIVHEVLSNPSTASLSIKDHKLSYIPDHPHSWTDRMSEYSLDANYNPTSRLLATIVWGGQTFYYDYLGHSWSYSWTAPENQPDFQWSLVDHSLKWQADYTSSDSIRSTRNNITTNVQSLVELCNSHNVQYDLSNVSMVYPIPLQNRQSARPMDWVNELVSDGLGDEWVFKNGNTFTPFYPNKSSPTQVIDFSKHVKEETVSGSWSEIYNHVVVSRAVEGSAHRDATNSESFVIDKTVDEFKDYEVEFSEPMFDVRWSNQKGLKGIFSDFLFINADGKIVKIMNARAPSRLAYGLGFADGGPARGVKKIRFTWGIAPGILGVTGDYGSITFTGIPYPNKEVWGGDQLPITEEGSVNDPLPSFRSEAEDSWSINRFGRKRLEVPANPIIATKQQADLVAQRTLAKVSRRSRKGDVNIHLNPKIKPGTVVLEKIYIRDGQPFTRVRFVTEAEHCFSINPAERYTRYSGITWEGL